MDGLFENAGKKIKDLAIIMFVVEVIGAIISGLALTETSGSLALVLLFVGPLFAWVSALFVYGFGDLIDKAGSVDENLNAVRRNTNTSYHTVETNELPEL